MDTGTVETAEQPLPDAPRRTHTADGVVAILLLIVHIGLALLMAFVAPFLAMGTDPCGPIATS